MNNKFVRIAAATSLILFLVCCVGVSLFYEPDIIAHKVSRTQGVAPLSVHFEASLTASSGKKRIFHTLDYRWNFGDEKGAKWPNSGKQKNIAKGAVATHVFDKAGHYTAQLTIKDDDGIVEIKTFNINVLDPDKFYSGSNTTVISDSKNADFIGAPTGSRQIITDDLSLITQYASAGKRILFHRGSEWTVGSLDFPDNAGPVTLGAFGSGEKPKFTIVNKGLFLDLNNKQNWTLTDLHFDNTGVDGGNVISGVHDFQRMLFLRLKVENFNVGLGWSHFNQHANGLRIDQMVISETEIFNSKSNGLYVGGERIALLGNTVKNSQTSHVVRVWQAYKSVINHNDMTGSSLNNTNGRHALKLHGPGGNEFGIPVQGSIKLANRTEFTIISDNLFGSSGPWPVVIGPQDSGADERLSDLIFERNRIITQHGELSARNIQIGLRISGRYMTVRNNILDGTGSSNDYTGIMVASRGIEPPPASVWVHNNTIYRSDNTLGNHRVAFNIGAKVLESKVTNNLVSFPNSTIYTSLLDSQSADLISSNNVLTSPKVFVDAGNVDPLNRDFRLLKTAELISTDVPVGVYSDFDGKIRGKANFIVGAFDAKE